MQRPTAYNNACPAAAALSRGLALRDMPFIQGFAALSPSLERHVGNAETLAETRGAFAVAMPASGNLPVLWSLCRSPTSCR